MKPSHWVVRTAVLLTSAVLLLGGCGIPATGVVQAGEPATGVRPPLPVYFVRNGTLVAVPRRGMSQVSVATAVAVLLKGPSRTEQRKGISTAIPVPAFLSSVRQEGHRLWIGLAPDLGRLSVTAVDQLVCTASEALLAEIPGLAPVQVTVTDSGLWSASGSSQSCPGATA